MTEGWITFETERRPRKRPSSACKDGQIWTLLTTMTELKGSEEKAGFSRPLGVEHGVNQGSEDLDGAARRRKQSELGFTTPALLRHHRRRTGRHRAGARLRTGSADDHHRKERTRRRFLAQSLQVALPARPRLVRPPALPADSPSTGRCSRPRTRSAIGWRCTPRSWS